MGKTKISWTETTWNPVIGCSRVSDGCRHCYAERMDKRIRAAKGEEFKEWSAPNAAYNVRLHPDRLQQPLAWKKPRMVFVNSMSDLFHETISTDFIREVFWVMATTPQHTYQILTKRPGRMLNVINDFKRGHLSPFDEDLCGLKNVWLGVSVENQRTAEERIPLLLQTPAAIRFLSCEPLLEHLQIRRYLLDGAHKFKPNLHWVIVGGESGPNFRAMNPAWARSIRDQCQAAGIPFFFKQHSGYRPQSDTLLDGVEHHEFPTAE